MLLISACGQIHFNSLFPKLSLSQVGKQSRFRNEIESPRQREVLAALDKNLDPDPDPHSGTTDPDSDTDRHQNIIDCSLSHSPPLEKFSQEMVTHTQTDTHGQTHIYTTTALLPEARLIINVIGKTLTNTETVVNYLNKSDFGILSRAIECEFRIAFARHDDRVTNERNQSAK